MLPAMISLDWAASYVHAKYKRYFAPGGLMGRVDTTQLRSRDELELLVQSLSQLESLLQFLATSANSIKSPAYAAGPPGFAEFEYRYGKALTEAEMRRVWVRRVAVALWSDRNGHWPWNLADDVMTPYQMDTLLGWNPEPDWLGDIANIAELGKDKLEQKYPLLGLAPSDLPGHIANRNGQHIFVAPGGAHHFELLWDPNPFRAWHIAWNEVRPGLQAAQTFAEPGQMFEAPTKLALKIVDPPASSRTRAFLAVSAALRRRAYHHYLFPQLLTKGDPHVLWPDVGKFAPNLCSTCKPDDLSNPFRYIMATTSLVDVWTSGYGGCTQTAPLMLALLRAMNVPARRCIVAAPQTSVVALGGSSSCITLSRALKWASDTNEPEFLAGVHRTVVSDIADARLALYHADDASSYLGYRHLPPAATWLPYDWWRSTMTAGLMVQSAARKTHKPIDDAASQWPFLKICSLKEFQARLSIAGMASALLGPESTPWSKSLVYAMRAPSGGKPTWLDRWKAAKKDGPTALAEAGAVLFEADSQLVAGLRKDPGIGPFGHWGQTRFPVNWRAIVPTPGSLTEKYGLATDAAVQADIDALVSTVSLLK
jgi:hypothetical protein